MPRQFPTPEDIALPSVQGPRPVASYDVSAFGQGGQALARAGQTLGADIQKSAQDVAEVETFRAKNAALLAQDKILGGAIGLREKYKHDTDYGTLPERYNADLDNLVQQGVQGVPEGPLRDHVIARIQTPLAHERASINEQAFQGRRQNAHADLYNRGNDLVDSITAAPFDYTMITARMGNFDDVADEYARQGLVTPLEAQHHRQNISLRLADAEARARINLGPAEAAKVERELLGSIPRGGQSLFTPPGSNGGAAAVIAQAETGDRTIGVKALGNISPDSKGSRSYGFLGLNSGTGSADAFVRDYGGQFGLTAKPGTAAFDAQWKAAAANQTQAFRTAQIKYFNERIVPSISADLQRFGVPADIASDPRVVTYFADRKVQMGGIALDNVEPAWRGANGDVPTFLRNMNAIDGTPQQLAKNFRSAIDSGVYGPAGHATRLRTRLEGALAAGESASPPLPIFAKLTPQHRDALIAHARAMQRQFRTDAQVQLNAGIKDDLAAASRDGYLGQGRSLDDFKAVYGEGPEAEAAFSDYRDQLQTAIDRHTLSGLSPDEQATVLAMHAPIPGSPGFSEQSKRYDYLAKAADDLHKQLYEDPGGYAITNSSAVREAWGAFTSATSPEERAKAAQDFASQTTAEQLRLGVPSQSVSIAPKGYIQQLQSQIMNPGSIDKTTGAGGPAAVFSRVQAEKRMWGDAWPQVARELGKTAEPVVRVLSANIDPVAGQTLAELAPLSFEQIAKDEDTAKHSEIKAEVLKSFKPLMASMDGQAGAQRAFDDFRGQGEKLAAYYVGRGATAPEAAKKAYGALIEHGYDMRDNFRVPKNAGISADDAQLGAAEAKRQLKPEDLRPALAVAGVSPDYPEQETLRQVQRDGVWVTSPGDKGLVLLYDHLPVRRRDGSAVELTWDQLANHAAAARQLPAGFPIYDATKLPTGARGRAAQRQYLRNLRDQPLPSVPAEAQQ